MRDEKLSTTVTDDEKSAFRVEAAKEDMNISQKLREIVYDYLEEQGESTSREAAEGNPTTRQTVMAD